MSSARFRKTAGNSSLRVLISRRAKFATPPWQRVTAHRCLHSSGLHYVYIHFPTDFVYPVSASFYWSHPSDSNRRPADYESAALPTELGWLSIAGLLRRTSRLAKRALLRKTLGGTCRWFSSSACAAFAGCLKPGAGASSCLSKSSSGLFGCAIFDSHQLRPGCRRL